jgi:hypothetical protein
MTDELHDAGMELAQLYADLGDESPRILVYTRPKIVNISASEEVVITIRRKHREYIPVDPRLIIQEAVPV